MVSSQDEHCLYVCMYGLCMHVDTCMHACMWVCMHVCMHIIYIILYICIIYRNRKLLISRAPTKAKSQEPAYSQACTLCLMHIYDHRNFMGIIIDCGNN